VLGLTQLIDMALSRSPELKRATQDIAIALSDLTQATAAQGAQVDVVGVGGIIDNTKRPIVEVSPTPDQDGVLRGQIKENDKAHGYGPFGKLEFTLLQEKTRGEVIVQVKELYFALILAHQGREAALEVGTFVEDARRRMQRLQALGSPNVDKSDLYRLEAFTH
jgi:outer membrane protein TolC